MIKKEDLWLVVMMHVEEVEEGSKPEMVQAIFDHAVFFASEPTPLSLAHIEVELQGPDFGLEELWEKYDCKLGSFNGDVMVELAEYLGFDLDEVVKMMNGKSEGECIH